MDICVPMNMNEFRKQIHDYITDNEEKCVPNIKFKSGKTKLKKYIEVEVKNRMWKECIDFSDGCDEEYWLDANIHLPIVSHMFNVNILLYDVDENRTTYFYETKLKKTKQTI